MNDQENRKLIFGNIAPYIDAESRDYVGHEDHLSAAEEGYVNPRCPVCVRDNPEWMAIWRSGQRR